MANKNRKNRIRSLCSLKLLYTKCSTKETISLLISQSINSFTKKWLWLNRDQSRKENYSQKTIHFQSVIWRVVDRRSNITASSVEHQKFQQKFTFTEAFRVNSRKSKQKNKNQGAIHFEIAIWKVIHKSCSNIASFSERLILREKIRLLKHFRWIVGNHHKNVLIDIAVSLAKHRTFQDEMTFRQAFSVKSYKSK